MHLINILNPVTFLVTLLSHITHITSVLGLDSHFIHPSYAIDQYHSCIINLSCCCGPFKYVSFVYLIPSCCYCARPSTSPSPPSPGKSTSCIISSLSRIISHHHHQCLDSMGGSVELCLGSWPSITIISLQSSSTKGFTHILNHSLYSKNICLFIILVSLDGIDTLGSYGISNTYNCHFSHTIDTCSLHRPGRNDMLIVSQGVRINKVCYRYH